MNRNLVCLGVTCFVLSSMPHAMTADEPRPAAIAPVPAQTAVASDRGEESAQEVARELLRLQQQLGGSVVDDRPQLENLPAEVDSYVPAGDFRHRHQLTPHDTTLLTWPQEQALATDRSPVPALRGANPAGGSKVSMLRETALLLDTKAHDLELLDLYEQADSLRAVATRLRSDARAMKRDAASKSAK
ncbi:MAG: hypothetical protein ACR2NM_13595 [Bythopirellula sp.]